MDPEKKSLNFIFPTKYVIPKSLKFSHWPSKGVTFLGFSFLSTFGGEHREPPEGTRNVVSLGVMFLGGSKLAPPTKSLPVWCLEVIDCYCQNVPDSYIANLLTKWCNQTLKMIQVTCNLGCKPVDTNHLTTFNRTEHPMISYTFK